MTHHRHYKHLHIPPTWEQYWSKYPNGYSIMESLIDWVSQVNKMIESFNDLSDEYTTLNRNMRALEKELRASWKGYKEHTEKTYEDFRDEILTIVNQWIATIEPTIQDEVVKSLSQWLDDGTLADIINEDVFNMKANQTDLEDTTAQLAQTNKIFREVTVNINDFGAVYDDETFDNMAVISEAQDYLEELGGGQIYFPDTVRTLYIKPFLNIKSGIKLIGAPGRAKLKLSSDVTNFWKVFGFENRENVAIENIEIDSNSESRTNHDLDEGPQIILSYAGSNNVEITNNKLIGNGVWIIAAFTNASANYSRNLKIRDNHIIWKSSFSTQKPDLPAGVLIDNTIMYFDAIDYVIERNRIETDDGLKNMTCIEAHGANATVKNNHVEGFRTGIIVWSLVEEPEMPIDDNNIKVFENDFIDVENGVMIGATLGYDLTNVDVCDNTILVNPKRFGRGSSRGIEVRHPSTRSSNDKMNRIKIHSNIVNSKEDFTTYNQPDRALTFTGIEVNGGNIDGLSILHNQVSNISGTGLKVLQSGNGELTLKDSVIEQNTFIDCGRNTNIATSEFIGRSALYVRNDGGALFRRVSIGTNYIYDTRPEGTYFTRPVYINNITESEQVIKTVSRPDWSAKRSYTPWIAFDSQIGTITTNRKGTYQFEKSICKVEFEVEVTATDITQGYGANIALPFEAGITEEFLGGRFNLIGTDNNVSGILSIRTNNLNVAVLQPVVTSARFPVGAKLVGQIEYPVSRNTKYIE